MSVGSTGSSSSTSSSSAASSSNPLQQLSSNFNDFMSMLLTQLQNQDPTSPMDTQSFTTELVQFTGVEQQVATNSSLSQLIQLTQADQVMQSSAVVGKSVSVQSSQLTLQSGKAALDYNTQAAEPVQITVTDSSGNTLYSQAVTATAGANTWTWNGQTSSGAQTPDGAYNVTVTTGTAKTAVPFTVEGTVTGMQDSSGTVSLQLGLLTVPMTSLTSMSN
jgi:flagellar basal-body rod modification protein FlgD